MFIAAKEEKGGNKETLHTRSVCSIPEEIVHAFGKRHSFRLRSTKDNAGWLSVVSSSLSCRKPNIVTLGGFSSDSSEIQSKRDKEEEGGGGRDNKD